MPNVMNQNMPKKYTNGTEVKWDKLGELLKLCREKNSDKSMNTGG